jgi:hypothetical protein
MSARYSILLALVVAGCHTAPVHTEALTAAQAGVLALKLANDQARRLYHCEPFAEGPPATLIEGRWVWHARHGLGTTDMDATVSFAADGANPDVNVSRFYSMPR